MPGVLLELSLTQPKIKITEGTRRAERASGESREEEVSVVNETHDGDLEVELLIPPPVNAYQLLRIHRKLRENHHVDILRTTGSWERGDWMKLSLRRSIDLKQVLIQMPEVAQVWETQPETKAFLSRTVPLPYGATVPNQRPHFVMNIAGEAAQP